MPLRGDGPVRRIVVVGADLRVRLIEQLALYLLPLHAGVLAGEPLLDHLAKLGERLQAERLGEFVVERHRLREVRPAAKRSLHRQYAKPAGISLRQAEPYDGPAPVHDIRRSAD